MEETKLLYTNIKVGKPKDSVVEIEGEIPAPTMELHRKEILREISQEIEVQGFRKGNVPEAIVLKQVNMNHILEDAAEEALNVAYPHILHDNNVEPLSSPRITFVKLAEGSALEFKISVAIEPEISLPNYKKIAKAIKEKKVVEKATDKDVDDIIKEILTMRIDEKGKVPELTDELVKTFGPFENVADFKIKMRENITKEKEVESQRLSYEQIAQELVKETKLILPSLMIEDELHTAHRRLHQELEKRKMGEEEYFKIIKKTEEEYMKEKKEMIERQLKMKFILKAIARKEGIKADEKEIEKELQHAQAHYPNTDSEAFRNYIEEMLSNEKTLKFLEEAGW
ncbi:MAG: trigger factor [Candidatus Paceibacterota bacterium]|jgi:FKBP-type peptidyl-prolyl cis-trans isomerase (trigger factor)